MTIQWHWAFLLAFAFGHTLASTGQAADVIWVHQQRGGGEGAAPAAGGGTLTWEDDAWRQLIEGAGHTILSHDWYDDLEVNVDRIEELNAADLVIFSRDSGSGDYNTAEEQEFWTSSITAPLLIMTPYVLRDSRWKMLPGESIVDALSPMEVVDPAHPIFAGITLDANQQFEVWEQLGADDNIDVIVSDPGNGTLLAVDADTGNPWVVYWEEGQDFHDASPWTAAGPRLYLSVGSDDDPWTWGEKNITAAGDQMVLNAINWMTGGGAVNAPGDFNGDGKLDVADLDLLSIGQKGNDKAYDLTGDGTTDSADRTYWANSLKRIWVGDANMDGVFNSGDLVAVFTVGAYETGAAANWEQGDWDGDTLFSSSDFVAAFSNGGYEQGPRTAVATVPEPTSGLLLLLGSLAALRYRKS